MVSYRLGDLHVPLIDNREALGKLVADFAASIDTGAPTRSDGEFGAGVVRVIEAALRSAELDGAKSGVMTGSPVPVRFTLMLPVLNEAARLPAILESIRRQRYPAEKVELLVADGGSTDDTAAIARSFGARVVPNPIGRAEPGAGLLLAQATGDVAMWLAADNAFAGEDFLEKMARPFEDPRITAAFPSLVSTAADGGTTRYFNAFSDPFNHFIYGGGTSPASYHRTYRVKRREPGYVVYDFASGPLPLIALAQGFTIRLPYRKPAGTDEDDVAPVQMLLARGCEIAYVEGAAIGTPHRQRHRRRTGEVWPAFSRAHDRLGISGVEPAKKLA